MVLLQKLGSACAAAHTCVVAVQTLCNIAGIAVYLYLSMCRKATIATAREMAIMNRALYTHMRT